MLGGGCISWASKLQTTVALSSAEAKYMAAAAGDRSSSLTRRELGSSNQNKATTILEDNQGCIGLSKNPINPFAGGFQAVYGRNGGGGAAVAVPGNEDVRMNSLS